MNNILNKLLSGEQPVITLKHEIETESLIQLYFVGIGIGITLFLIIRLINRYL